VTSSTIPATLSDLSGQYVIDPGHTRIGFVARHAMVTKVRGTFNDFEGSAVIDGTDFSKSTGQLTIQAASIDSRNEQRDAHLRSNDFLAMEEYPQITFVATDVRQAGPTTLELTGDLTIRGVTNSVTIPFEFEGTATDPYGNLRVGFEGSTVINRKDYGITWNAALETGGRPSQRQDHPRVRGLCDQDRLTCINAKFVIHDQRALIAHAK
jgi:polyisoprenoid-binding protein YceI